MNKTSVFMNLDNILNDAINKKLQKKLDKLVTQLKSCVSEEHHDFIDTLVQSHTYNVRTVLKLNTTRKSRTKREIVPETRCMARIGLGNQCSRSRMDKDYDYCKSHYMSRPYGRIDVPEPVEKKMAKRRGRRSKNDKNYTIDDLDIDKYVQAILININDEPYLLDQNNILYQFNGNNEIVGYVEDEKVEWY